VDPNLNLHASTEPGYKAVMRLVEQFDCRGRVLDFGCGTGNLSKLLWDTGRFDGLAASDIVFHREFSVPEAKQITQDLNEPLNEANNSFDLVVGVEIIEHLENPRQVIREWYRVLKPNGRVIFTTPNNESLRALSSLMLKGHYSQFVPGMAHPEHITPLLRQDMRRHCNDAGFRDLQFFYTNSGMMPILHWSWQKLSGGNLKGLRFSDNIVATAIK
jgi:2-polyprenyl-3-methyl-5-hydroxy-6-metoxy-1,4-benzoquinol methylase